MLECLVGSLAEVVEGRLVSAIGLIDLLVGMLALDLSLGLALHTWIVVLVGKGLVAWDLIGLEIELLWLLHLLGLTLSKVELSTGGGLVSVFLCVHIFLINFKLLDERMVIKQSFERSELRPFEFKNV